MTDPPFDRPRQPTLLLPPISELPGPTRAPVPVREPVLTAYLRTSVPWYRRPMSLPVSVVVAMWVVLAGAAGVGGWLIATRHAPHGGLVYRVATLGHPGLLLILSGICVVTLLGLVPFTRGLTRAGGPELAAMVVAGLAGVGSLAGLMALAVLAALAGFLTLALIIAVFE